MNTTIQELMTGWSAVLQLQLSEYADEQGLDPKTFLRVDLVLALLRINSEEARQRAGELVGRPITHCPSGVPPWPPKPVRAAAGPRIELLVVGNPCAPTTDMHKRFAMLKKGLTKEQVMARGITKRDIQYWTKHGHIKFTEASHGT